MSPGLRSSKKLYKISYVYHSEVLLTKPQNGIYISCTRKSPAENSAGDFLKLAYLNNQINLLIDCNLHEATESTNALNADGCAGIRRDHIRKWCG